MTEAENGQYGSSSEPAVSRPFVFTGKVDYNTRDDAYMVMTSLSVDPELRPQQVQRKLTVDGSTLHIYFEAVEARLLRAAVGTFFDLLNLATRTLETFDKAQ